MIGTGGAALSGSPLGCSELSAALSPTPWYSLKPSKPVKSHKQPTGPQKAKSEVQNPEIIETRKPTT